MNTVTVKLAKKTKAVGKVQVLTRVDLQLQPGGSGTSQVPATRTAASIEFVELAKNTVIGTLTGQIAEVNKKPVFFYFSSPSISPPSTLGALDGTDFSLSVGVGAGFEEDVQFTVPPRKAGPNSAVDMTLRLPWELPTSKVMKIGVRLKVGKAVESDTSANETADIQMSHPDVQSQGVKGEFVGSHVVYPAFSEFFTATSTIRVGTSRLNVFFEPSSFGEVKALAPRFLDFATLKGHVETILKDAGFPSVSVQQSAGTAGFVKSGSKWGTPVSGKEVVVPMFDFYICAESGTGAPGGKESARSAPHTKASFDVSAKTKKMRAPAVMVTDKNGTLETNLHSAGRSANELLANLVVHEIAHSFGLVHPLEFNGTKHVDTKANGVASSSVHLGARKDGLMFFGPVHKQLIKDLFL